MVSPMKDTLEIACGDASVEAYVSVPDGDGPYPALIVIE